MAPDLIAPLTQALAQRLQTLGWSMATAESCTGGMIAARCTDLAGSSQWFERGFVTYSNEAKVDQLGVSADLILRDGAVSHSVARAMAVGAVYRSLARVSLSVTGIAGPSGGSAEKPVGTVWIAWCIDQHVSAELKHFDGDRAQIRNSTMHHALHGLLARLTV